jgi:hypothetical protein
MDGNREDIVSLIEALAARGAGESMQLVVRMGRHCWPGGPADRTTRVARDWVKRWGPRGVLPPAPGCSCESGRCVLCN